ncbi:MAG: uroporphyrinogen-III synthase, partial [Xanthomonadaceae bacterium]|nr:uroporphyrinogen-III synthase [Xanthomonadaceae bacterium]
ASARAALAAALRGAALVFVSPAAVRFAARLAPLRPAPATRVLAVGQATARALLRHGVPDAGVPRRQDSEGLLGLAPLDAPRGRMIAVVGAAGGRGLLQRQLRARGATLREVTVYRRLPARLDTRHLAPLAAARDPLYLLLSSSEALNHLRAALPAPAWARLRRATAIVSSERLAAAARAAGLLRVHVAASALAPDLLSAVIAAHARQ